MRNNKGVVGVSFRAFVFVAMVAIFIMGLQSADANVTATHIADATAGILNTSISVDIDPSVTNWVAWHDQTTPTLRAGVEYVGSYSWIAVDDFFDLTVTNPLGASSTVRMDFNNAWGLSSGTQAVIYGTAAATPNVARWGASWSPASAGTYANPKIFDEGGAFNSLFTTAGTYNFSFLSGNTGASYVYYPNMYLLVDADSVSIPAPSALILGTIGAGFVGLIRKRKNSSKVI